MLGCLTKNSLGVDCCIIGVFMIFAGRVFIGAVLALLDAIASFCKWCIHYVNLIIKSIIIRLFYAHWTIKLSYYSAIFLSFGMTYGWIMFLIIFLMDFDWGEDVSGAYTQSSLINFSFNDGRNMLFNKIFSCYDVKEFLAGGASSLIGDVPLSMYVAYVNMEKNND